MTHESYINSNFSVYNKGLLEPSHLIHLHPVPGYFHAKRAELNSCDRDSMAHKAYIFTPGPLQRCEHWNKHISGRIARQRDVGEKEKVEIHIKRGT